MKPAFLVLLLCLPVIAVAQSTGGAELRNSGTEFVRVCGAAVQGQTSQYAGVCNIWLTGVMDGLQAYNSNTKVLPLFDAPNVTVGQVSKLVVNYVTSHPQQAQFPTAALVALVENYPRKEAPARQRPRLRRSLNPDERIRSPGMENIGILLPARPLCHCLRWRMGANSFSITHRSSLRQGWRTYLFRTRARTLTSS